MLCCLLSEETFPYGSCPPLPSMSLISVVVILAVVGKKKLRSCFHNKSFD